METIIKTTLIGLFFGTFGTTLGGIIGVRLKKSSNKFLSFILSFASGLMTAIICFELVPEAMEIASLPMVILGMLLGIIMMIICEIFVDNLFQKREKAVNIKVKKSKESDKGIQKRNLLKTGMIVSIGLAIHNFPEGLAIGSGFEASLKLGLSLAIAICFHDIPEGISMAVPMKNGGMKPSKVIYYVVLSGITTGVGALFGALVGGISQDIIAICLAFAAGAMIYIVSGELTPESNKLYQGRMSAIGNILGFIIGVFAMNV